MPSAAFSDPRAQSSRRDELDRLLDDDDAVEEFFQDLPRHSGATETAQQQQTRDEDQEVQVKRKRVPIPKLDENRLLSDAGIPKLRRITKSRPKFRGKGHEFTDISNLLNTYQLWLDDLYPRAKFRDAVKMVEKVGHSKRMQVTRRAWLDDTKPNRRELTPPPEIQSSNVVTGDHDHENDSPADIPRPTPSSGMNDVQAHGSHDTPGDDELEMMLRDEPSGVTSVKTTAQPSRSGPFVDDEPDEDELDALLAEPGPPQPQKKPNAIMPFEEGPDDDDDDELQALMAEQTPKNSNGVSATAWIHHDHGVDFADDEEAMRDMW